MVVAEEKPSGGAQRWCPTLTPTRQQFQRPFMEFVSDVFKKNPDLPMFKVRRQAGAGGAGGM